MNKKRWVNKQPTCGGEGRRTMRERRKKLVGNGMTKKADMGESWKNLPFRLDLPSLDSVLRPQREKKGSQRGRGGFLCGGKNVQRWKGPVKAAEINGSVIFRISNVNPGGVVGSPGELKNTGHALDLTVGGKKQNIHHWNR